MIVSSVVVEGCVLSIVVSDVRDEMRSGIAHRRHVTLDLPHVVPRSRGLAWRVCELDVSEQHPLTIMHPLHTSDDTRHVISCTHGRCGALHEGAYMQ